VVESGHQVTLVPFRRQIGCWGVDLAVLFASIVRPPSSILWPREEHSELMKLSLLAILMGLGMGSLQVYGLAKPAAFTASLRKLPRSIPWGNALIGIGTIWFLWNLGQENIADFAAFKKYLLLGFAAIGIGTCIFVRDYLGARGLAVVFLLLAKLMVDTGRPHLTETHWVLVIQTWAYLLVVAGIWLTVSPYRLRDAIDWATANATRVKVGCGLRLAFAAFVVVLGLTAFRGM
jgi:hypothetical protein